jgi:hypothetical protein
MDGMTSIQSRRDDILVEYEMRAVSPIGAKHWKGLKVFTRRDDILLVGCIVKIR